jgi:hypothetical protein
MIANLLYLMASRISLIGLPVRYLKRRGSSVRAAWFYLMLKDEKRLRWVRGCEDGLTSQSRKITVLLSGLICSLFEGTNAFAVKLARSVG